MNSPGLCASDENKGNSRDGQDSERLALAMHFCDSLGSSVHSRISTNECNILRKPIGTDKSMPSLPVHKSRSTSRNRPIPREVNVPINESIRCSEPVTRRGRLSRTTPISLSHMAETVKELKAFGRSQESNSIFLKVLNDRFPGEDVKGLQAGEFAGESTATRPTNPSSRTTTITTFSPGASSQVQQKEPDDRDSSTFHSDTIDMSGLLGFFRGSVTSSERAGTDIYRDSFEELSRPCLQDKPDSSMESPPVQRKHFLRKCKQRSWDSRSVGVVSNNYKEGIFSLPNRSSGGPPRTCPTQAQDDMVKNVDAQTSLQKQSELSDRRLSTQRRDAFVFRPSHRQPS